MKYKLFHLFYTKLFKPIFFLFDPETMHDTISAIGATLGEYKITQGITRKMLSYQNINLEQEICGIKFKNPIGLSAGFDKDAKLQNILPHVGFGFMTIGTVTLNSYEGNPKPRLYRLKKSRGLVVNYGLKSRGVGYVISRLKNFSNPNFPICISIGKTNSSQTAEYAAGVEDYYQCTKKLVENNIGDFYEINISCPNTFGGEPFTTPEKLEALLIRLTTLSIAKPVFIKMPINLPWEEFEKLLDVAIKYKINGVTIGNLNKNRADPRILDIIPEYIKGNISGKPTWELSNELISKTYQYCGDKLVIIGVGGVFSPEDAYTKIKLGASLVGLITGMIYEGPQLIGEINQKLSETIQKSNFKNISEAIGLNHRNL